MVLNIAKSAIGIFLTLQIDQRERYDICCRLILKKEMCSFLIVYKDTGTIYIFLAFQMYVMYVFESNEWMNVMH